MTSALTRWLLAVVSCLSAVSWSQEPAASQPISGPNILPPINIQVRNGEVLSVSGPDLFVRLENGRVAHYLVPETTRFNIDGRSISLDELKPGMRLTDTITTIYAPELSPPVAPSRETQKAPPTTPRIASGKATQPSPKLPATATTLPLLGLVGLASLLAGWCAGKRREV